MGQAEGYNPIPKGSEHGESKWGSSLLGSEVASREDQHQSNTVTPVITSRHFPRASRVLIMTFSCVPCWVLLRRFWAHQKAPALRDATSEGVPAGEPRSQHPSLLSLWHFSEVVRSVGPGVGQAWV